MLVVLCWADTTLGRANAYESPRSPRLTILKQTSVNHRGYSLSPCEAEGWGEGLTVPETAGFHPSPSRSPRRGAELTPRVSARGTIGLALASWRSALGVLGGQMRLPWGDGIHFQFGVDATIELGYSMGVLWQVERWRRDRNFGRRQVGAHAAGAAIRVYPPTRLRHPRKLNRRFRPNIRGSDVGG